MRTPTARYFMRLKYHQGFWDGVQSCYRGMARVGCHEKHKKALEAIRSWAETELKKWDESAPKKDWRQDRAPFCPVRELVAKMEPMEYPDKPAEFPFMGKEPYESSFISMFLTNDLGED